MFLEHNGGEYVRHVIGICRCVLLTKQDQMPDYEACGAVKLLESMLHNCRARIDHYMSEILYLILKRLEKTKHNSSIRVLLFSAFSGCLYYNSPLTLHLLGSMQEHGQSGIMYSWMEHLYSCTKLRPAQLKVSILAISAMLELPTTIAPLMTAQNRLLLVRWGSKLLFQLGEERVRRQQQAQIRSAGRAKQQQQEDEEDGEIDDDGDVPDKGDNSLASRILHTWQQGEEDDFDDNPLEEEEGYTNPLDVVDELVNFATACHLAMSQSPELLPLLGLSQAQPEQGLASQIPPEETACLHHFLQAGLQRSKMTQSASQVPLQHQAEP